MTIRTDPPYIKISEFLIDGGRPVERIDPRKKAAHFTTDDLQKSVAPEVIDRVFAEFVHYKEEREDKLETARIQATFTYKAQAFFHKIWSVVIRAFEVLANFFRHFCCVKEAIHIAPPAPPAKETPGKIQRDKQRAHIKSFDEDCTLPLRELEGIRFQPSLLVNLRWHDLRNYSKETFVTINKYGSVMAEASPTKAAEKYAIFMAMLKATYGARLAKAVCSRNQYDKAFSPEKGITIGAIREAIVIAAASVTVDDLRDVYEQVKAFSVSNNRNDLRWGVVRMMPADALKEVGKAPSFEHLTTSQMKILVDAFRKISVFREKKPLPVLQALFNQSEMALLTSDKQRFWFNEAVDLLAGFEALEQIDVKEHFTAIISEFFAKHAAYRRIFPGMIIPGRTSDGAPDFYICEGRLSSASQKEVFSTLWSSWTHPDEAHLIFRGTQFHSHIEGSGTSVIQNAHYNGIAKDAYLRHEGNLLKMLEAHMRHHVSLRNLGVHGHSQGAVFAQRMLVSLIHQMLKKEEGDVKNVWQRIETITLFGHNAPAVESSCNLSLGLALKALKDAAKLPKVHVNYVHFSAKTGPDVVQQQGSEFLGHEVHDLTSTIYYFRAPHLEPEAFYLHRARGWLSPAPRMFELSVASSKEEKASFFSKTWMGTVADWTLPVLKLPVYGAASAALAVASVVSDAWSRYRGTFEEHPVHAYDKALGLEPFFMRRRVTLLPAAGAGFDDTTIDDAGSERGSPGRSTPGAEEISVVAVAGAGAASNAPLT